LHVVVRDVERDALADGVGSPGSPCSCRCAGDPLGRLSVSAEHVAARDRLIVRMLADKGIPTVVVTSGGYSRQSHELTAQLAMTVVQACEAAAG
jgi:acetoin utilization deacetylase AcuC-like enzyme